VDWLTPALSSAVISMAVLVAAYAYLYGQRRQSEMGLWALGWTAYLGYYFGLLAGMFLPLAMLWHYLSLALLGLSAFFLWAGTRHFVGHSPSRRAYAWGVLLPIIWAGVAFLGLEERPWLIVPTFIFAGVTNLFTTASLYRYSRSGEDPGGAKVAALGYGLWGMLELAYPCVSIMLSPPLSMLPLALLLANGLTLTVAISLVGLSIREEERKARQQAEQLESLRIITAAVSQVLEPDEVLDLVARQAAALVGAETVAIPLVSEDGTYLIYKAAYGRWADQLLRQKKPIHGTSICGWVTRTRAGFYSENLAQDERTVEEIGEVPGLETAISAPLLTRGKAIGAIVAFNKVGGGNFTYADLEQRLQPLADQAAVAIENARLYAAQQRRAQESRILLDIAGIVSSTLDLTEVLKQVTQHMAQVCGAHRCTILILAEDGEMMMPTMSQFGDGHIDQEMWQLFKDARYPTPVSQVPEAQRVIREQRPLFVPDTSVSSLPRHWIEPFGVKSLLIVPLVSKERVIGLMGLDHVEEGREFTAEQVNLAMAIAAQAAIAIENARLFGEERDSHRLANTLREIAQALNSTLSLNDVLCLILAELEKVIAFDSSSIMLLEGKDLVIYATKGFTNPDSVFGIHLDLDMCPLNREVAESKRPLIVGSAHEDERWLKPMEASGLEPELRDVCSWMGVPLVVKDQVIGILTLDKAEAHFYSEKDAEIALTFASQAAIAIENARLFEETRQNVARLEKKTRDLELVHQVSQVVSSSLNLTRILETTAEQMVALFEADHSGILLFDQAQIYGQVVAEYPSTGATAERFPVQGYLAAERIIADREPLVIEDTWNDPLMAVVREAMHRLDIRSMLIVPLIVKGEVVGSIGLDAVGRQRRFGAEEVALAQTIANQVSIAIQNARLFEEARQRARQLESLIEVGRAIGSTLDLDEVLQLILDRLEQVIPYDAVSLWLREGETMRTRAVRGFEASEVHLDLTVALQDDALSQEMVSTRRPLILADAQRDERFHGLAGTEWVRSWLGVPLLSRGEVIGLVTINKKEPGLYTAETAELALAFGQQAAVAIENARLYEETRRYVGELTALHTIDIAIASTLNLDEVLRQVYEQVSTAMNIAAFHIALYDEEKDELHLPIIVDQGKQLPPLTLEIGEESGLSGWVVRTREALWIGDMDEERDTLPAKAIALGVPTRSLMVLPLIARDKLVGVMSAQSYEPYAFDEGRRRLFSSLANQVAIAIENARLFEETNRRLAETRLLQEVMQAAASTLDFDEVLTRTIETLHKTLGIEYLTFVLPGEGGTGLILHPSRIGYPLMPTELHLPLDGSVTGWVYQSGEPQIIPDVRDVPCYFEGAPEVRSELAVPVKVAGRVIAVLNAESPHPGAFGEDDLRLFQAVAAQLGVVLENARLYEDATQRLAEARLTQEVMLAAASTLDFDLVLERTVKALHRALGIARLGFLLPDERDGALVPHPPLVGLMTEGAFRIPIEGSLVGRAYRTGQPVLVQDAAQEPAYFEQAPEVRSVLAVPVRIGDHIVAVLYAESPRAGVFGEDELRLFTTISGQLGVTLESARLYQRLEAQTAELSRAYGELQETNRLRIELVQNVGHELRTPLSLIQGYVELLLEGDLGRILDSQRAALQVIRERTATLTRLIHNLTMLQAVPQETLALAPVSVVEVAQRALAEFRRSAERAGITFREELPGGLPLVLGDRERLELVFGHLADNAIKFSPGGGTITVRAWADENQVYVSVTDEGIGIAPDHMNHIFERFYQVDGTTKRRFGGMGVGLALVWEIVEAHGGTVEVESEAGEGSTFTVALPQAT